MNCGDPGGLDGEPAAPGRGRTDGHRRPRTAASAVAPGRTTAGLAHGRARRVAAAQATPDLSPGRRHHGGDDDEGVDRGRPGAGQAPRRAAEVGQSPTGTGEAGDPLRPADPAGRTPGVSEKLMARLRRDHGRGRETDDGRLSGPASTLGLTPQKVLALAAAP